MSAQTTPYSILATHYLTHSVNRKTSAQEFNSDAEFMTEVKRMYMTAQQRYREMGMTDKKKKFADMVFSWCKDQTKRLQEKHWGK